MRVALFCRAPGESEAWGIGSRKFGADGLPDSPEKDFLPVLSPCPPRSLRLSVFLVHYSLPAVCPVLAAHCRLRSVVYSDIKGVSS